MQANGAAANFVGPISGTEISNGILVETGVQGAASASTERPQRGSEASTGDGARLQLVVQKAIEIIGSEEEAFQWLGTRVRALNFATPISLVSDEQGAERVLAVLTNLEHGVW